jgi:hypothetical protein
MVNGLGFRVGSNAARRWRGRRFDRLRLEAEARADRPHREPHLPGRRPKLPQKLREFAAAILTRRTEV